MFESILFIHSKLKEFSGIFTVPGSVRVSRATSLVQPGLPGRVSQLENACFYIQPLEISTSQTALERSSHQY